MAFSFIPFYTTTWDSILTPIAKYHKRAYSYDYECVITRLLHGCKPKLKLACPPKGYHLLS
jgi:hypothetical protein